MVLSGLAKFVSSQLLIILFVAGAQFSVAPTIIKRVTSIFAGSDGYVTFIEAKKELQISLIQIKKKKESRVYGAAMPEADNSSLTLFLI